MTRTTSLMSRPAILLLALALGLFAQPALPGIYVTTDGPGAVDGDTIICGQPVTFNIHYLNDAGENVVSMVNGFRLYSPDGAEWETPVYETTGSLDSLFDLVFLLQGHSVDGVGADTISLGTACLAEDGMPNGYDDVALRVETCVNNSSPRGDTLCIDSAFYPPNGVWNWTRESGAFTPSWGGPYTYTLMPNSELHVTATYIPGPDCHWEFDFSETIYHASQVANVVFMEIPNPPAGFAITGHGGCAGSQVVTHNGNLAIRFDTPNLPTSPCTGYAEFDNFPKGSPLHVVFDAYVSASDPWPCATNYPHTPTSIGGKGECDCYWPPKTMCAWYPFDNDPWPYAKNARGWRRGEYYDGNNPADPWNGPQTVTGMVGDALCFDGIDDRINVKFSAGICIGTHDFTVDAWVKRTGASDADGVRQIVDSREDRNGDLRGFSFFLYNGSVSCQIADGTHQNWVSTLKVPLDNQWHFVAVTVDRDQANGWKFYLDNQVYTGGNPTPWSGSLSHYPPDYNRWALRIGDRMVSPDGGADFIGCIDEVEVYQRALAESEVLAIHQAGSHGKCKTKPLVGPISLGDIADVSVTVPFVITNSKSTPQTYDWSIYGVDYGEGPVPATFTPSSGTVTVAAGEPIEIPVEGEWIQELTGIDQRAWYEVEVHNTTDDEYFYNQGALALTPHGLSASFPQAIVCAPVDTSIAGNNPIDLGSITVSNPTDSTVNSDYRIIALFDDANQDTEVVSLNGLAPGTPVEGNLELAADETAYIDLTGEFVAEGHMSDHTIMLQFDVDGEWYPAATMMFMCVSQEPIDTCWADGDANGDEIALTPADLAYLTAFIQACGPAPVPLYSCDLTGDGVVNQADLDLYNAYFVYGLSVFEDGYPVPCPCNPVAEPWPDTVNIFGLEHVSVGAACLGTSGDTLIVTSRLASSGEDGVTIDMQDSYTGWHSLMRNPDIESSLPVGASLSIGTKAIIDGVPGQEIDEMSQTKLGDDWELAIATEAPSFTIEAYLGDSLVYQCDGYTGGSRADKVIIGIVRTGPGPEPDTIWANDYHRYIKYYQGGGGMNAGYVIVSVWTFNGVPVRYEIEENVIWVDRIKVTPDRIWSEVERPVFEDVTIVTSDIPSLSIVSETHDICFEEISISSLGNAILEVIDTTLVVSNIGPTGEDGVDAEADEDDGSWDDVAIVMENPDADGTLPIGASLQACLRALSALPGGNVLAGAVTKAAANTWDLGVDFSEVGSFTVEAFNDSALQFTVQGVSAANLGYVVESTRGVHPVGFRGGSTGKPAGQVASVSFDYTLHPDGVQWTWAAQGVNDLQVDEIRITMDTPDPDTGGISNFSICGTNPGRYDMSFTILDIVATPSSCCVGDRGNVDGDLDDVCNIVDLTFLVAYLFGGGDAPRCEEEADVNADGAVNIVDLTYLTAYLFGGGAPPLPCGESAMAPPAARAAAPVSLRTAFEYGVTTISIETPVAFRGIQMELSGAEQAAPVKLVDSDLELLYHQDRSGAILGILDLDGGTIISAGTTELVRLDGRIEVTSALISDMNHQPVVPNINPTAKSETLPQSWALHQNYPNPFNPTTTISFTAAERTEYTLTIYNTLGRQVTSIAGIAQPGDNEVVWDASGHSSGVYFYKLEAGGFKDSRKMILLK